MASGKVKVTTVCLRDGVDFIGWKLVGRVAPGNQQIQFDLSRAEVKSQGTF